MTSAQLAAHFLAQRFMLEGKMAVTPRKLGSADDVIQLAARMDKREAWEQTLAFANVGVQAVGYSDGYVSDSGEKIKPSVTIYIAKALVKDIKALPPIFDGVDVRTRKVGLISVHPDDVDGVESEPHTYTKKKRIACGSSCATATGYAGTFGAIVEREGEEDLYMLSCNHVLAACNQIELEMPILVPAPDDARPGGVLPLSIARLHEAIAIQTGSLGIAGTVEEDVALGRILNPEHVSSWQGSASEGFDTPFDIEDPKPGMRVKKFGRTTGLTHGMVDALVAEPYPIHCQAKKFKGDVWFKNVAYIDGGDDPFALPGDSGSLVVTEDGTRAVGLLFSSNASGQFGQIIPMRHVATKLGVTLKCGHGNG